MRGRSSTASLCGDPEAITRHGARRAVALVAWVLAILASPRPAAARVFVTPEQAVKEAFGDATVEKKIDYLTEDQAGEIAARAGSPPSSKIVTSWRAMKDGHAFGTAYLDTHLVRTLPETILVVIGPEGRISKVEILSFDEPEEYLPKTRWLDQFTGRTLDAELSLKTGLRGVTGATLSSRAIASAVRRVLATHQILSTPAPLPSPAPAQPPPPSRESSRKNP